MNCSLFRGFLQMAVEPVAHGGEQLALEIRLAAGSESRIKRRGEHQDRHPVVDGCMFA